MTKKFKVSSLRFQVKSGITLIEMLLYMALMSIFLVVLTDILVSIIGAKTESETFTSVEQDGRYILARLSYDINRANSITAPAAPGDSTNNLILTIGADTYAYTLAGENLQLQVNATGADNLNGTGTTVTSINFQKLANISVPTTKETVKLQFVLESKATTTSGKEVKTFQTTIGRR